VGRTKKIRVGLTLSSGPANMTWCRPVAGNSDESLSLKLAVNLERQVQREATRPN
jgi:hypothetical protein